MHKESKKIYRGNRLVYILANISVTSVSSMLWRTLLKQFKLVIGVSSPNVWYVIEAKSFIIIFVYVNKESNQNLSGSIFSIY